VSDSGADVTAFGGDEQTADLSRVLKAFREIRSRVSGPVKVRRLIDEGRRS